MDGEEGSSQKSSEQDQEREGEQAKTEEPIEEPKPSFKQRMGAKLGEKTEKLDSKFKEKLPKVHEKTKISVSFMKEVWFETFPMSKSNVQNKIQERKAVAKMQREMCNG